MTTSHRNRAHRWTLTRRLADWLWPNVFPGQRHAIWGEVIGK